MGTLCPRPILYGMKNQFAVISGVVIIIGFFVFIMLKDNVPDITNYPSEGETIVAFGDSLVEGTGSSNGNDFVSLLEVMTEEPILNLGRIGDTTEHALARMDSVIEQNPKIVIVLLGGNDFLQKIPKETTYNNLARIIQTIQDSGAIVVLLGVQEGLIRDQFKNEFKQLRDEYGTAFVSNVLENLIGRSEFMFDSIHPNDKGYRIIADRVYPVLKELLE